MHDFDETPELNITPLVDIMLVLLAILMVTIPTVSYREDIALPQGSKTTKAQEESIIEIQVTQLKKILIRGKEYDFTSFPDNFALFAKEIKKTTPVYITADKHLIYDDVVYILKSVKEAGFSRASLVTSG
ncbi:biopolymer transporter ExbD [Helicobacter cholecystus]|uniref:Biopolymer transporter ExbD n=1 Tax=Helicobacter cholecystus TaxID=45498 RepID=A0A3D8IUT0_9HELI|nr:biopolymer transporter ExbD [Helicobacter cholecystus]RDU68726.1 biopolymer transporter ExbD [Helicobacter cholecystus]VEJ26211.1 ExbD/TolR family biopolymer transport protein [Helicobacter cholecystus]